MLMYSSSYCMPCSFHPSANNNSTAHQDANAIPMLTTPDGQQLVSVMPETPDKKASAMEMSDSPHVLAHQDRLATPGPATTPVITDQDGSELTELRPVPTEEPTATTTTYLPMPQQYISKSIPQRCRTGIICVRGRWRQKREGRGRGGGAQNN